MTTLRPVRALSAALVLVACCSTSRAADAAHGIELVLAAAQQDRRGVTLYVAGQTIAGAVLRIEPGQWVELRHPQAGRIVVRLDRIDGLATP